MTDLRKAAEQAVTNLEELISWHGIRDSNDKLMPTLNQTPEIKSAMETLEALRQALAQPEQEPVAWMHNFIDGNVITHKPADIGRNPERWTALYSEPKPCPTCEALARTVMMDQTSHDTAPPKREWVGLTDEELKALCYEWQIIYGGYVRPFAETIETKLKERNT